MSADLSQTSHLDYLSYLSFIAHQSEWPQGSTKLARTAIAAEWCDCLLRSCQLNASNISRNN